MNNDKKTTPVLGELPNGGTDVYGPEFFRTIFTSQIQEMRDFYLGKNPREPDVAAIRTQYNRLSQFRKMCDDDDIIQARLPRWFQAKQHEWDEYYYRVIDRLGQRLRSDPEGQDGVRDYPPGKELANRFLLFFWHDLFSSREHLAYLKDWLSRAYQEGNDLLRTRIMTDVLVVLFEDREIAKFFSDWQDNPILGDAYREALRASQKE